MQKLLLKMTDYINEGLYKATRIDSWDGWVKIDTDHKHLIEDY